VVNHIPWGRNRVSGDMVAEVEGGATNQLTENLHVNILSNLRADDKRIKSSSGASRCFGLMDLEQHEIRERVM
jgi:hypothetical protein